MEFYLWSFLKCEHCVKSVCIFYLSAFSNIRSNNKEILRISQYSVQMQENTDQKNSEYGHFLRSESR